MNEALFFLQIILCPLSLLIVLRWGKAPLVALTAVQALLANLFLMKQIDLFGLTLTSSDPFALGTLLGITLIQEYFGEKSAKETVKAIFGALLFFTLAAKIQLCTLPAAADRAHPAFEILFSSTPRIVLSSLVVFFIAQRVEIWIYGALSKSWYPLRLFLSLFVAQGLDTLLFSFAALYGLISPLLPIIVTSFGIKCLVLACGASFAALSRRWINGKYDLSV
ncbi:MAG: queuosine precursor transporter [Verrucomicrobiota bacterium]|nr:queuosine precursor transporter [Verrucomicrobiota bacterium]